MNSGQEEFQENKEPPEDQEFLRQILDVVKLRGSDATPFRSTEIPPGSRNNLSNSGGDLLDIHSIHSSLSSSFTTETNSDTTDEERFEEDRIWISSSDADWIDTDKEQWEVIKSNGSKEAFSKAKLKQRLTTVANISPVIGDTIDLDKIIRGVTLSGTKSMTTDEIDALLVTHCYYSSEIHPDYDKMAVRLCATIDHRHSETQSDLSKYIDILENVPIPVGDKDSVETMSMISTFAGSFYRKHASILQEQIDYTRDFTFSYFGYITMMKTYALRLPTRKSNSGGPGSHIGYDIFERAQHAYMRTAVETFTPDPLRYLSHFIKLYHCENKDTWDDNYDDWLQDSPAYRKDMVNTIKKNKRQLPAHITSLYESSEKRVTVSDLWNPFVLPASKIQEMVSRTIYDGGDVYGVMRQYIRKLSTQEEATILNYIIAMYHMLSLFIISIPTPIFQTKKRYISCFLMGKPGDSIPLIYQGLKDAGMTAKDGGGQGAPFTRVRPEGSYIAGSNCVSNGIIPIARIFDESKKYVDQGGNKRAGPITLWIETWHSQFFDFIDALRSEGGSTYRATGIKGGVWLNRLLLQRAKRGESWSFFCPKDTPNLLNVYGDDFEKEYIKYEKMGLARSSMPAHHVMIRIANTLIDSAKGACHVMNCDNVNEMSIGRARERGIKVLNSNICTEITQYSDTNETATCVLATLCLKKFYTTSEKIQKLIYNIEFHRDHNYFRAIKTTPQDGVLYASGLVFQNRSLPDGLDLVYYLHTQDWSLFSSDIKNNGIKPKYLSTKAISRVSSFCNFMQNIFVQQTSFPTKASFIGTMNQRGLGLGFQGIQDTFVKMNIPYGSKEAQKVIFQITNATLYGTYEESINLAKWYGICPYWKNVGSRYSVDARGELPFDAYLTKFPNIGEEVKTWFPSNCKWERTRLRLKAAGGKYNLDTTTSPPTATSSNVAGNNEGLEPFTSLTYKRRTATGEYIIDAKQLTKLARKGGYWTESLKNNMRKGSIQSCTEVPQNVRDVFKSAWELGPRVVMDLYFYAQINITQSLSMNLWMAACTVGQLAYLMHYGEERGLSTTVYYLHKRFPAPETMMTPNILETTNTSSKEDSLVKATDKLVEDEDPTGCGYACAS